MPTLKRLLLEQDGLIAEDEDGVFYPFFDRPGNREQLVIGFDLEGFTVAEDDFEILEVLLP